MTMPMDTYLYKVNSSERKNFPGKIFPDTSHTCKWGEKQ